MSKRKKPARKSEFRLTDRERITLQNWESVDGVSPKLTCVIDGCGSSTVYNRIEAGEYEAYKDGRLTKITTASIKARRANLSRFHYNAAL
jgi:hypothetical protein